MTFPSIDESVTLHVLCLERDVSKRLFILPDEFNRSNAAQYDEADVRLRSNPFRGYSSGGPSVTSLTIPLHDDLLRHRGETIMSVIDFFEALAHPHYYTEGNRVASPRVLIRIGDFFKMRGNPDNVDVTFRKPYRNGIYLQADISVTMSEALRVPLAAVNVHQGERR